MKTVVGAPVIRVLVVDDDFMVARLHSSVVAGQPGFQVVGVASTGAQALEAVRTTRPDLVLLDIYLPDMTGLEVLKRLRENAGSAVDVIVISAARDLDTLRARCTAACSSTSSSRSRSSRCASVSVYRAPGGPPCRAHRGAPGRRGPRLPGPGGPRGTSLPKGISQTIDLVLKALEGAEEDGLSAMECAECTGLSRSSTRRYLEHLVSTGAAEMRRYGAAGRPERRYRLR